MHGLLMARTSKDSKREAQDRHPASWPSCLAAISLALVCGLVGDRMGALFYWPFDRFARLANGMEPLPVPFIIAWRNALSLPEAWWLVISLNLVFGFAFILSRTRDEERRWRVFWFPFGLMFVVWFVAEGRIPDSGFTDYGIAHYTIKQFAFFVVRLLNCGFAWLGASLGWFLTMESTWERLIAPLR